jgi:tetratricopeptide (TPR) repeat protein
MNESHCPPADGALALFKRDLRKLARRAETPGYRPAGRAQRGPAAEMPRQTRSDLLSPRTDHIPRWENVEMLVRDCLWRIEGRPRLSAEFDDTVAAQVAEWRRRYEELKEDAAASRLPRTRVIGRVPPPADHYQDRAAADVTDSPLSAPARSAPDCLVVTGLSGIGKTQAVVAHVEELSRAGLVDVLIWVNASSRDSLLGGYGAAIRALEPADERDPDTAAARLLDWLAGTQERWIVVLDDLAAPGTVQGLWPPARPNGRTIVTTTRRDAALSGPGRTFVELGPFDRGQTVAYLSGKLADRAELAVGVARLADLLGGLPLVLAQVATYILDRGITCQEYVRRWDDATRLEWIVPEDGALPDEHRARLTEVWDRSIARADELQPAGAASRALNLLSFLDPSGVPVAVLATSPVTAYLGPSSPAASAAGPSVGGDALACLNRLSLVTLGRGPRTDLVFVHAMVQRACRDRLARWSGSGRAEAVRVAAEALLDAWPEQHGDTELISALRDNAGTLLGYDRGELCSPGVHELHFRFGRSLGESGDVRGAVQHFHHLHLTGRARLGVLHPDTLRARADWIYWRAESGQYAEVLADQTALIEDLGRLHGRAHPEVLGARIYHGRWTVQAGDVRKGRRELEQVTAALARSVPPDDTGLLTARNDLAFAYGAEGDPARAAEEYRELLSYRREVLGPDHPHVIITQNDLAYWLREAGRYAESRQQYAQLLGVAERVHGPRHPNTLAVRMSLARVRAKLGDLRAAEDARQVLSESIEVMSEEHPRVVRSRAYLREIRRDLGLDADGDAGGRGPDVRSAAPDHVGQR